MTVVANPAAMATGLGGVVAMTATQIWMALVLASASPLSEFATLLSVCVSCVSGTAAILTAIVAIRQLRQRRSNGQPRKQ